jgi:hypothetical protein
MRFKEWRQWLGSLPWTMQWFVLLVLIRPVIDVFYLLKHVSPVLSPGYIVGVLTPVLILLSFNSSRLPKKNRSKVDHYFLVWGGLVFINIVAVILLDTSLYTIGNALKYFLPILLFFYLRRFIRSKADLHGLLQTFLYSAVFPALLLVYEHVLGPISTQVTRGSEVRSYGAYADIFNYGIYIVGSFLILGYFYLEKSDSVRIDQFKKVLLFLSLPFIILGLFSIKHTSSWAVFLMLFMLFLLFRFRTRGLSVTFLMVVLGISIFAQDIFESQIQPLVTTEIMVLEGEAEIEKSFHGRASRWKRYFDIWEEMPVYTKLLGVSLYDFETSPERIHFELNRQLRQKIPIMLTGGMHSDYVRILFLSGGVGLVLYLLFLFGIFQQRKRLVKAERYLVIGAVLTVLLYSVSSNPNLYQPLLYYILPIFAYALLPVKTLRTANGLDRQNEKESPDPR